jgi:7-cyano-7-deazaguanine synthase
MNKENLIILSGGMDSTTLLYEYKDDIAMAISFDYGSKHNHKELVLAKQHCKKLSIKHEIVCLPFINQLFKSSLLKSGGDIPEGHYEDESMKQTVVPFRNGIMLAIAAGVAESNGLNKIMLGNHAGDHAIYPDCRYDFVCNMSNAIEQGTYNNIVIVAPYTNIDKRAIALIGNRLGIDYSQTWTCYKGLAVHCGVCGSCTERKEALAGFDVTEYLT